MARILIIYHRSLEMSWRSTYTSHLRCIERFTSHECHYLNTAQSRPPRYLTTLEPDAVVFHYTFLALRAEPEFATLTERIGFLRHLDCPKALIPHDEQTHADRLCSLIEEFGITHVFTPALESEWAKIYHDATARLKFRTVLTGYVDETILKKIERLATKRRRRIDVGYRSWDVYPQLGRHGQLKGAIGRAFAEHAPRAGLVTDISSNRADALLGDSWFEFLLDCRYTIGTEGGSSVLDRDGSIAERSCAYTATHPGASFEEIEAACFPGVDGGFDYKLLGPRHLEAVMTRTGQILVEGEYGGVLKADTHYIELKRDFSNLDEVIEAIGDEGFRAQMTERAYHDVVASGAYSYKSFADLITQDLLGRQSQAFMLDERAARGTRTPSWMHRMRVTWRLRPRLAHRIHHVLRRTLRPALSKLVGEDRLRVWLDSLRKTVR